MSASKGQVCEIQITANRWSLAVVTKIISGDQVNLVALTDGVNPWPLISTPNGLIAEAYTSVNKGTGVGEWRELALPATIGDAIAAALIGIATEAYVDSGLADLEADVVVNCAVVSQAGTSPSPALAFNVARQPSTTRPTRVTATGSMMLTSTILGAQTATVTMVSDSNSTPTTVRAVQPAALSGVAAGLTVPWTVTYDVPAGHYYALTSSASANASCSLLHVNETAA